MESKKRKEITFLSNFSWSAPNVLELLSETAIMSNYEVHYYSKPRSILKRLDKENYISINENFNPHTLRIFSSRCFGLYPISFLQNYYLWKQITSNINYKIDNVLIYNNLDVISGISKKLEQNFDKLIFLCADYSDFNDRLDFNCRLADCIMVIPKTMTQNLKGKYPEKKIIEWPQPVSAWGKECPISDQNYVDELLLTIPKPRVIYAGDTKGRVNDHFYHTVADKMPHCSFISFHDNVYQSSNNLFKIPWINKPKMHYLISQCQVGFMPYNTADSHNLHCVPLKLFDYFKHGLPVVSSRLLNLQKFDNIMYMSDDVDDLTHFILLSLNEIDAEFKKEKRMEVFNLHCTSSNKNNFTELIESIF